MVFFSLSPPFSGEGQEPAEGQEFWLRSHAQTRRQCWRLSTKTRAFIDSLALSIILAESLEEIRSSGAANLVPVSKGFFLRKTIIARYI